MIPMESITHDIDASTSTSTGRKSYNAPKLSSQNAIVLLMAPVTPCDSEHVNAMYVSKTSMSIKCHI